jgi:hypothetical protein
LLEHGWNDGYENRSNIVDVYVGRLRAKIRPPTSACHSIETMRGRRVSTARRRRRMTRVPIKIRLTHVFTAVMATVLAATGLFLYLRLGAELDRTVKEGLRSRADDVGGARHAVDPPPTQATDARLTDRDESLAQVIDARGRMVVEAPAASGRPVLTPQELERARRGTTIVDRRGLPASPKTACACSPRPCTGRAGRSSSSSARRSTTATRPLDSLLAQMLIGGPAALLLATLTAFAVTRAAVASG